MPIVEFFTRRLRFTRRFRAATGRERYRDTASPLYPDASFQSRLGFPRVMLP
jgi:hypothetical protein